MGGTDDASGQMLQYLRCRPRQNLQEDEYSAPTARLDPMLHLVPALLSPLFVPAFSQLSQKCPTEFLEGMAEAVRFELTEELPPRQFSRLLP